jgi:hypothetical protein
MPESLAAFLHVSNRKEGTAPDAELLARYHELDKEEQDMYPRTEQQSKVYDALKQVIEIFYKTKYKFNCTKHTNGLANSLARLQVADDGMSISVGRSYRSPLPASIATIPLVQDTDPDSKECRPRCQSWYSMDYAMMQRPSIIGYLEAHEQLADIFYGNVWAGALWAYCLEDVAQFRKVADGIEKLVGTLDDTVSGYLRERRASRAPSA